MTDGVPKVEKPKQPILGVVEWFGPGEQHLVESSIQALESLGIHHIRVGLPWADWYTPEGRDGYEWLIRVLSRRLTVLPSLVYVPPSLGAIEGVSSPPENPKAFAEFVDTLTQSFGDVFEWIELPSEPDHTSAWDWRLDPRGRIFSEIIGSAAYRCQQRGIGTVLGGVRPADLSWLGLLCENGVVDFVDAVGLHVSLGARPTEVRRSPAIVDKVERILEEHHRNARVWITEAGCATSSHDDFAQLQAFADVLDTGVERVYWHSLWDLDLSAPHQNGDERRHCSGLLRRDGTPRLLFRLWDSQGIEGVRRFHRYGSNNNRRSAPGDANALEFPSGVVPDKRTVRPVLITGGAGFIGSNMAERLLRSGRPVIILDNLSRCGVEHNVRHLCETYGDLVEVHIHDVRDRQVVERLVARCGCIFHFAAQVAVTTSLVDPLGDFESNLQSTVNILEAARKQDPPPPLLFTSTNKVYGDLHGIELVPIGNRYVPRDHGARTRGIDESRPLDFHSPYGCSKGAADQYVLDYARMYGMSNTVFRMSCIYGRRQFGTEDEGWVAHFALQMLDSGRLTIYGDGRQVRDILYVDDLIDAMLLVMEKTNLAAGKAFNIGGGPENAVSLLEVIQYLSELSGIEPQLEYGPRRKGDQPYYVSDTRRFRAATGWTPRTEARQGIARLYQWIRENAPSGVRQAKR